MVDQRFVFEQSSFNDPDQTDFTRQKATGNRETIKPLSNPYSLTLFSPLATLFSWMSAETCNK